MPAFFLSLLAAALATIAGRECVRVARLAAVLGPGVGLILAIGAASLAASAAAAWFGAGLAGLLAPAAKAMFVAIALVVAAAETALLRAGPAPREPTRSTAAIFLVLLATLTTDAARFIVLALAAATGEPPLAFAGGALGSAGVLVAAALAGEDWERRLPLRAIRWAVVALLVLAAITIALPARGLIG